MQDAGQVRLRTIHFVCLLPCFTRIFPLYSEIEGSDSDSDETRREGTSVPSLGSYAAVAMPMQTGEQPASPSPSPPSSVSSSSPSAPQGYAAVAQVLKREGGSSESSEPQNKGGRKQTSHPTFTHILLA